LSWFPKDAHNAERIATSVEHESGHEFGLVHQSIWSSDGTKLINEYNPGNSTVVPIMGNNLNTSQRHLWQNGVTDISAMRTQDELGVIAGSQAGYDSQKLLNSVNHLGYYDDGIGHTQAKALGLGTGTQFSASGVIAQTSQSDYYAIGVGNGNLTVNLSVAAVGPTFRGQVKVLDSAGNVLGSADSNALDGLGASLTINGLSSQIYYLQILSHGGYGDVGSYQLQATFTPVGAQPATLPNPGVQQPKPSTRVQTSGVLLGGLNLTTANVQPYGDLPLGPALDMASAALARHPRLGAGDTILALARVSARVVTDLPSIASAAPSAPANTGATILAPELIGAARSAYGPAVDLLFNSLGVTRRHDLNGLWATAATEMPSVQSPHGVTVDLARLLLGQDDAVLA
jgi:hypothetical protein